MATTERTYHPLSKKHFKNIVKRPPHVFSKLYPIWALTFVTRGKMLAPLGSVSLQVISSQPDPHNSKRESIELTCLTAEVEHATGVVHFSRPRMSHDFGRNPQPGARKRVLDPREPDDPTVKSSDRPNADWVRWALDADKARSVAADNNYRLLASPQLPKIVLGFANPELVPFEVTTALQQEIANHMGQPLRHVEAMDLSVIATLGRAHWDELFTPPDHPTNRTGLYLIDAKFVSNFSRATRVYEDYSDLCGVDIWNPARDVARMGLTRDSIFPTSPQSASRLAELLGVLSHTHEADVANAGESPNQVEAMENELLELLSEARKNLGCVAGLFTDYQVLDFVNHPEQEVLNFGKHDLVDKIGEEATAELLRSVLGTTRPHLLPYVDDSELVAAAQNLAAPLHVARLPRVQVLRRDLRVPIEDALKFGPQQLRQERVYGNFWPGDWSPRAEYVAAYDTPRTRQKRRRKRHGVTK